MKGRQTISADTDLRLCRFFGIGDAVRQFVFQQHPAAGPINQDQLVERLSRAQGNTLSARAISARGRRGSDPPVLDPRSGQE